MAWTTPKTWASELLRSSDMNTHIRDNLNALKDPATTTVQTTGVINVTSTSLVDVAGTSASFTTAGGAVLVCGFGRIAAPAAGWIELRASVDAASSVVAYSANNAYVPFSFFLLESVAAGNHTVKMQVRVSGGTGNIQVYQFWAREMS